MNSMEMVQETVRSASESRIGEFTKKEEKLLSDVVKAIQEKMKVGCTGCGYCMPCPKKVDIPGTFAIYNKSYTDGWIKAFEEYLLCTVLRKDSTSASNCIECGKCEQHCPQGIAIRQELKMAKRRMEGPVYKISKWFVKTFLKY